MRRIMFYRGLREILPYPSACPQSEIVRCVDIRMGSIPTRNADKRLTLTRGFIRMLLRQARNARPSRKLLPHVDPQLLSDLLASRTKVLPRPTPDTARGLKVAERPQAFDDQRSVSLGRQRDGLSRFAVEQLLDRCSIRFSLMSLALSFRAFQSRLTQQRPQRLGFVPVTPRQADVYADIAGQDICREDGLDAGELHEDTGKEIAVLSNADLARRPERRATAKRILEPPVCLRGDMPARRWLDPIRIRRAFRFLNLRVTGQREVRGAGKRLPAGLLRDIARVNNAPRSLLCLVRQPAQAFRALRLPLGFPLRVVLCAVVQRVAPVPVTRIAGSFRLAGVRLNL